MRDISSSGTFYYDTTTKINKDDTQKTTSIDRVTEIEKVVVRKYMFRDLFEIEKCMVKKSLLANTKEINIQHSRTFRRETPEIQRTSLKTLTKPDIKLNKATSIELKPPLREINMVASKEFENVTPLLMECLQGVKFINIHQLAGLNKCSNINVEIDRNGKCDIYNAHETYLGAESPIEVSKVKVWNISKGDPFNISKEKHGPLLDVLQSGEIRKYNEGHCIDRIAESEIIKDHTINRVERVNNKDIGRDESQRLIMNENIEDITIHDSTKLITNEAIVLIDQHVGAADLERIGEKLMDKDTSMHLFYRMANQDIDRIKEYKLMQPLKMFNISKSTRRLFTRLQNTNISKISNDYVDRMHTTDIFKIQEKYADRIYIKDAVKADSIGLNDMIVTQVYKEYQKPILNLSVDDIYKERSISLNGTLIKEIELPRENKFIEVTKRWWWLNDTSLKDHLIVPNKDYGQMASLLNNYKYEYLRYTNHPIEWGQDWGKDANVPPASISIEIMVDIVNIITMIWHKNVQGWLSVSGKEAVQLLMELLYDWYSMSTSYPNHSYYRAYRWIRWEAEKVYFLDTTSGLQAIGILVKNLREYLKWHHFNRVPIWRNPKAMDEERNYNKLAQNADLMTPLDKNKGKRHYFIESQNFEKKNKLIQELI
ncbi:hypothetical protein JOC70_000759 [Clostridium pascui]|nr:hypothetical protein [Clostridium pascui]